MREPSFALCLTHDVDRPYKTYQSVYHTVRDRDPSHLLDAVRRANPYWQFETVMELEDELGVRSAFYFLDEQSLFRDRPVTDWVRPSKWLLYAGRYSLDDPAIVDVMRRLDARGWEIGIHGSYDSYLDRERLRAEKEHIEDIVGHPIVGGRQHHLNLDVPRTWELQADAGLRYDSSLGSAHDWGFQAGYDIRRPFDDDFVVFPLTLMDIALPDPETEFDRAWAVCESLLSEAERNDAVMTVLWHPRMFSDDFGGHRRLYRRLVERALERGAWVGPPREWYALASRSSQVGTR